ncbi:UDP-glycosyltransferase 71C5 [Morus notabilis]|uniref:Glycosyltransferase n=1 Tax=Morus notabilis TaxID=981085 RepID=W9RXC9_9ROSA|nr:UDP-glycosyltransferase 71K1 [Morus notabilis]EXC01452.1 UDP-glycosyltransferase 71C5 [Morus notabilis]
MKKFELVFVPSPATSHLVSTIEIAKRLMNQDDRISVTILCMKAPTTTYLDAFTKSLVGSETRIKLVHLPQVDPPPTELITKSGEYYIYAYIESFVPHVRDTLKNILSSHSNSHSTRVSCLVLDFFCMPMLDVANELDLPCYLFFTCNLGYLSLMLRISTRHELIGSEFKDSDPDLILPGFMNPIPTRVLPLAAFNKDGGYTTYLQISQGLREIKGIFVNSFAELESPEALRMLSCDGNTPPIYMVGPVVDLKGQPNPCFDQAQHEKIMKWLDKQPNFSVLLLSFGSFGQFFKASQLRELALGLERSGCRFLWCLRSPSQQTIRSATEGIILPEGFLERTKGRGMICEWAPQMDVLAHKATGGFVSHCGWNSMLESLWHGVPVATWPIYAEQQLNAFRMVWEFGLSTEVRLDYREGGDDVTAEEIEVAIRRLMEGGVEMRSRVKEMSQMAKNAVAEGGSSSNALGELVKDIIGSN